MEILNIELEEKVDYTLSITYRDDLTNLPIDITGWSALLEIRNTFGGDLLLETLSSGNGRIAMGGATGALDIIFVPSDTDAAAQTSAWTRGAYDLILTDTGGKKVKILKGFVSIGRTATL
jgi:hypothetical protein